MVGWCVSVAGLFCWSFVTGNLEVRVDDTPRLTYLRTLWATVMGSGALAGLSLGFLIHALETHAREKLISDKEKLRDV
jgi:hypothetical protein